MIGLIFSILMLVPSFGVPIRITDVDFKNAKDYGGTWECYSTTQIKKMKCRIWVSTVGEVRPTEHSDLDWFIETQTEVHEYGFNGTYADCKKELQDIQRLLKKQRYYCILGDRLSLLNPNKVSKKSKDRISYIYEGLKTDLGQITRHRMCDDCREDD